MLIVGLTGGIASGKSTVSNRLKAEYGLTIIDADKIAREVVNPGEPAYIKIVRYFGPKIDSLVKEDGSLNRAALGGYVFSHKNELSILNAFTHPEVRKVILKKILKCWINFEKMCILDVPLLYEAKMDRLCGKTICVVCDRNIQLNRLKKRNPELSREDCENRLNSQMSTEDRIRRADIVLQNNATPDKLYADLDKEVKEIEPTGFLTYLEVLCPPVAAASAIYCVVSNTLRYYINEHLASRSIALD